MKIKVNHIDEHPHGVKVEVNVRDELKAMGLKFREIEHPDRQPIDFVIEDDNDNVAWVWGTEYPKDYEWECNHPYEAINFDLDPSHKYQGQCKLCGAWCDWHEETEECDVEDHHWTAVNKVPHQWYTPNHVGGLIRKYLEKGAINAKN